MPEKTYAKFDDQGRLIVNTERWQSVAGESRKWRGRYRAIVKHIPPGSAVIEFGCGDMVLRDLLPRDCRYRPSDVVSRSPDCWVIDLNAELPADALDRHDVAVFAGVLEYVADVQRVLRWAAGFCGQVIFSYATTEDFPDLDRRHRSYGWFSHLSHPEVLGLATADQPALRVERVGRWHDQTLYRAEAIR